jgi:hypothetical protein
MAVKFPWDDGDFMGGRHLSAEPRPAPQWTVGLTGDTINSAMQQSGAA